MEKVQLTYNCTKDFDNTHDSVSGSITAGKREQPTQAAHTNTDTETDIKQYKGVKYVKIYNVSSTVYVLFLALNKINEFQRKI